MCFFPILNNRPDSPAGRKGLLSFKCGACPECLRDRSNAMALTSIFEAREHVYNCMVTLTYDTFKYDSHGNILGENPVDPTIHVCKRHVQLFIKRLRKWCGDNKIKYRVCAEYGSRTHRAHYHALLFGVRFPDLVYYKKSKRGNVIYRSNILTRLWSHGICTVDCINVNGAVSAYCTKYCAKSRCDDTFMLASHYIGLKGLIDNFNGREYIVDGRHYPIPRVVWEWYIVNKYAKDIPDLDPRYVNYEYDINSDGSRGSVINRDVYDEAARRRRIYIDVRDSDPVYRSYLAFWQSNAVVFKKMRLPVLQRIYALPEKYHNYKISALNALHYRNLGIPVVAPGSHCVSAYARWRFMHHLPLSARHNTASDTKSTDMRFFNGVLFHFDRKNGCFRSIFRKKWKIFFENA